MITLTFHLEPVAGDGVVWWIDSPEVPGFYASASQIDECRSRALEALNDEGYDTSDVVEALEATMSDEDINHDVGPAVCLATDSRGGLTDGDPATVVRTEFALV